ncbi:MAG: radical SAM protein [Candidatus Lokiarchaeia archaeon]
MGADFVYPRYITKDLVPFDPIELARKTEQIVSKDNKRKYTEFYVVRVYRGISTGYTVGCNFRCFYCWSDKSRDFPEKYGRFYSPEEAFERLARAARRKGVNKFRISGAEPTLGKRHLIELLGLMEDSDFPLFILESNGTILGVDEDYVEQLSKFNKVYLRVSLKAGNPEGFSWRTGARDESFELPFKAIQNLWDHKVNFHCAAMTDPRIMPSRERKQLLEKLAEISSDLARNLEEEVIDPYPNTLFRLRMAGVNLRLR